MIWLALLLAVVFLVYKVLPLWLLWWMAYTPSLSEAELDKLSKLMQPRFHDLETDKLRE